MKRFKKLIGLVLCLSLVLSSLPMTALATTPNYPTGKTEGKVVLSLDFMGKGTTTDPGEPKTTAQTLPDKIEVNDVLWFAIGVEGLTSTNWPSLTTDMSIGDVTLGVNYDADYIAPFAASSWSGRNDSAKWTNKVKALTINDASNELNTDTLWDGASYKSFSASYGNDVSKHQNPAKSDLASGANAKYFKFAIKGDPDDSFFWKQQAEYSRFNDSNDNRDGHKQYLVTFPVKVLQTPSDEGRKVIELSLCAESFVICLFANSDGVQSDNSVKWDETYNSTNAGNAKTYFKYAGDPNIFPAPVVDSRPTLTGSVSISGDYTYGEELTATPSLTTTGVSSHTPSYQWYTKGTATGDDWVAVSTNGTSQKLTLTADMIGKYIKVEVSATETKGSVSADSGTSTVAKKELSVPTLTVPAKTYDGTTAVTAITDWTNQTDGSFTKAVADANKVGSDAVSYKVTATYNDANAGTGKAITTTLVLTGDDADNYAITGSATSISGVTGDINKAKLTLTVPTSDLTATVGTAVDVKKAAFSGDVEGHASGATISYAVTNAGTTGLSTGAVTANVTPAAEGTAVITATLNNTGANAANYEINGDASKTYNLAVSDRNVTKVEFTGDLTTKNYAAGETLDLSGLKVKVTYDSGEPAEMSAIDFLKAGGTIKLGDTELTLNTAKDGVTNTATTDMGTKNFVASMGGVNSDPKASGLTVSAATISSITVAAGTVATTAGYNGAVSLDGLSITVSYTDGTSATDWTWADLKAKGYTAALDGTALTYDNDGNITTKFGEAGSAAITIKDADGTTVCTINVTVSTVDPIVTLDNLSFYVGGTPAVTGKLQDGTTAADTIEYLIPAGGITASAAAVNCTVTGCLHTDGTICDAAPCTNSEHTAVSDHDATCGYQACTTKTGCIHADKTECGYKAAVTAVPAADKWVKADEADLATYVAKLTAGQKITVRGYLGTAIANKFNATTLTNSTTVANPGTAGAEAVAEVTVNSRPSSGGGGGGGSTSAYTVTFKAGTNGTFAKDAVTSVKVDKNAKLASKDVPTVTAKEGYKFLGWSTDGKTVVDPTATAVTKAVTYTALYSEKSGSHIAYMKGNEKGQFLPDANITRAEAAALLGRLIPAFDEDKTYTGNFSDVSAKAWYANEVYFDVAQGYITGYEDGTFKPENKITRQEFAIIVARYLGLENEGTCSFADCSGVYAEGYISKLVGKGIMNGYEDGTFRPNAYITRAEVAKVLNGVFDRVPDKDAINENASSYNVSKLIDVSTRHWAYYEIVEAAFEHEIADFH